MSVMELERQAMLLDRQAFVLTRGWRDTPRGIALTFWLLTDEGPVRLVPETEPDDSPLIVDLDGYAGPRRPLGTPVSDQ